MPVEELILSTASAGESLAQAAPGATAWYRLRYHELCFALTAETFLTLFHRAFTRGDGHGTKLDAASALLAEIRPDAEGVTHTAVFSPTHEVDRLGFPDLITGANAASA